MTALQQAMQLSPEDLRKISVLLPFRTSKGKEAAIFYHLPRQEVTALQQTYCWQPAQTHAPFELGMRKGPGWYIYVTPHQAASYLKTTLVAKGIWVKMPEPLLFDSAQELLSTKLSKRGIFKLCATPGCLNPLHYATGETALALAGPSAPAASSAPNYQTQLSALREGLHREIYLAAAAFYGGPPAATEHQQTFSIPQEFLDDGWLNNLLFHQISGSFTPITPEMGWLQCSWRPLAKDPETGLRQVEITFTRKSTPPPEWDNDQAPLDAPSEDLYQLPPRR